MIKICMLLLFISLVAFADSSVAQSRATYRFISAPGKPGLFIGTTTTRHMDIFSQEHLLPSTRIEAR